MNSRMEKYNTEVALKERTAKNKKLYDEIQDMNIDFIDINVDDSVEFDPNKIVKKKRTDYQQLKKLDMLVERPITRSEPKEVVRENRVYDINEILSSAREHHKDEDNKKRLLNTEYNILAKLDIANLNTEEDLSTANLHSLIESINQNELQTKKNNKPIKKTRFVEEDDKDLLNELMGDKEELHLTEDLSKAVLEEKQDTTENAEQKDLRKEIFEDKEDTLDKSETSTTLVNELEATKKLELYEKKSKKILILVILIVTVLFVVGGYLIYQYFFN